MCNGMLNILKKMRTFYSLNTFHKPNDREATVNIMKLICLMTICVRWTHQCTKYNNIRHWITSAVFFYKFLFFLNEIHNSNEESSTIAPCSSCTSSVLHMHMHNSHMDTSAHTTTLRCTKTCELCVCSRFAFKDNHSAITVEKS